MSDNSNFEVNAERIYDNLELLEKGRVYELQKLRGCQNVQHWQIE